MVTFWAAALRGNFWLLKNRRDAEDAEKHNSRRKFNSFPDKKLRADMGTWGVDTFENDAACDWLYGLEGVDDLSYVNDALNSVLETGDDYLDSDVACEALAACEAIARLNGRSGQRDAYTETVDNSVEAHPLPVPPDVVQSALAAIDRILTPPSEVLDLWSDALNQSDSIKWRDRVKNLRSRVAGE